VLGTSAKLGRTLQPGDDKPESRRTVVLGHGFWQRQFGGDPDIIGRTLVLSDVPYTVVGVMPENLLFPSRADVWTPAGPELAAIAASIRDLPPDGGDVGVFYVLGRLKAGTILALPVAAALLPALVAILPPEVPRIAAAALNVRVFGFAALAGMITAAVSSVIPAVRVAHRDVDSILRRTSQSMLQPGLRHPVRRALIGGELAAAVVLVTAAGLLARSVWQLRHLDIGFDAHGVIAIEMGMPMEHMADSDRRLLLQQALDRILLVPGVRSASGVSLGPLNGPVGLDSPYDLEGQAKEAAARNPYINTETITPAYFDTMRTRVLAGRTFDRFDREGSAPVVIVSRQFAERGWPGQDRSENGYTSWRSTEQRTSSAPYGPLLVLWATSVIAAWTRRG
jgi:MacB-like periplasmic core domain